MLTYADVCWYKRTNADWAWKEQPVDDDKVVCINNVTYSYRGVLETDKVPEAEHGVGDHIRISGVKGVSPDGVAGSTGSQSTGNVEDEFDMEFAERRST